MLYYNVLINGCSFECRIESTSLPHAVQDELNLLNGPGVELPVHGELIYQGSKWAPTVEWAEVWYQGVYCPITHSRSLKEAIVLAWEKQGGQFTDRTEEAV